jgi:hypothetical protein
MNWVIALAGSSAAAAAGQARMHARVRSSRSEEEFNADIFS